MNKRARRIHLHSVICNIPNMTPSTVDLLCLMLLKPKLERCRLMVLSVRHGIASSNLRTESTKKSPRGHAHTLHELLIAPAFIKSYFVPFVLVPILLSHRLSCCLFLLGLHFFRLHGSNTLGRPFFVGSTYPWKPRSIFSARCKTTSGPPSGCHWAGCCGGGLLASPSVQLPANFEYQCRHGHHWPSHCNARLCRFIRVLLANHTRSDCFLHPVARRFHFLLRWPPCGQSGPAERHQYWCCHLRCRRRPRSWSLIPCHVHPGPGSCWGR